MKTPPGRLLSVLVAAALLVGALAWGRSHHLPDLATPIQDVFPDAERVELTGGVHHVYDGSDGLLGWAGAEAAGGYGGPMLLLVGIDTVGRVVGVRVVEQRETPVFWRMVRAPEFFGAITGSHFQSIEFDYPKVAGVTGATLSANAIVESVRASVAQVAGEAFDVRVPLPPKPFEFGLLELVVLLLFAMGVVGHKVRGPARRHLRWVAQIIGLVVLGFWKNSPITLAKITTILSGFFPDPRSAAAVYLLLAGFLLTSVFYGRNLYCLYACPFGAAQRVIGLVGGGRMKISPRVAAILGRIRDLVVFSAVFLALAALQPALASFEPFAALFALHGSTLQWFLLFITLTASLMIQTPWCNFFCPMRTFELVVLDTKRWIGRRKADGE